ncbi:MAG: RuBisCO large subunit C-terminal-like domain-containing protein [Wenzhouxiangella sp.]
MELIEADYLASQPTRPPEQLAEAIAREQSLEILDALIPDDIRRDFLGRVLSVEAVSEDQWRLRIGYPAHLASAQIGQLMHLLYGNVSFYPRIRLVDARLPASLLDALPGPLGGIPAIRRLVGSQNRALLLTVLKPRGSSPETLARLAEAFALGGGDILKDDQNLVETDLNHFRQRLACCAQAIERAAQTTGRRCLYLPHVAGSGQHLQRQLDIVAELGLHGVVLCPWFMGMETAAAAARSRELLWLSHPAGAGVWTETPDRGASAEWIFGRLPRLAGADLSIYPGSGGRITAQQADESGIIRALTRPLGHHLPTLPCSGGGKTLAQVPELASRLGPDLAVVVGGDLLLHGDGIQAVVSSTISKLINGNPGS